MNETYIMLYCLVLYTKIETRVSIDDKIM